MRQTKEKNVDGKLCVVRIKSNLVFRHPPHIRELFLDDNCTRGSRLSRENVSRLATQSLFDVPALASYVLIGVVTVVLAL